MTFQLKHNTIHCIYKDWDLKLFKQKTIRYSLEKNVILALENGSLLDDIEHPNKDKYPNQNIFIILIEIKNYVYLVPYVEDETSVFLKTIIPSRQMNKKYNKNQGELK